ncbi:MAG: aminotransferase class III-fold pyridoxal phosphate-dependent enzyme [Planctomycetota bacterium]|nr:MAG: aminotransferase class III-fold pyridoxal phosphate-dependent enzyme [Planctomycetota bacterium]REK32469.1 MAG: aminotransferase class III-fold pyridoxal phosphate-dependent enzyme [Planctomycetota bacterium]
MDQQTAKPVSLTKISSMGDLGTSLCRTEERDRELFARELAAWVPPRSFDAHAHLYDLRMLYDGATDDSFEGPAEIRFATYRERTADWMGDKCPRGGLFFPFPRKGLDRRAANAFLLEEVQAHPDVEGLMMIAPQDDPADVEAQVKRDGWRGFKVYHVFAEREKTFHAESEEFLPEWAWEIADRRGLAIMLHMVLDRALADERNQVYIREHCIRYPGAKLVLAHAARGFCAAHTVEGIGSLRGLSNVWFDTSAVCEPAAMEAILRTFGTTRLLFGTDFGVSEVRGEAITLGDGFWWLYEDQFDWSNWTLGRPTKVGIQSLLAVKQACRTLCLRDDDVERIFRGNAEQMLGLGGSKFTRDESGEKVRLTTGGSGARLYAEAKKIIPGGTQLLSKRPEQFAPDQWPSYFSEAHGCEVVDLDGRRYLDFTHNGVGSCLLGYGHPAVKEAVLRRVSLGSMSSLNSPEEVDLARALLELHPWAGQVRFARGGGEAMSIAARIARAATGRDVVAFCGYHGWTDWYLSANLNTDDALDGHLLPGLSPAGVPRGLAGTALPFSYNDLDAVRKIAREHGKQLAAVIMEPTRNTEPAPGFLEGVREVCDQSGARLVFDEVTTGFRFQRGGMHLKYGVEPDVAVFAKALGSGHPIAAVIGRTATMEAAQETFISSTYWTEGVGATAALATLGVMRSVDVPAHAQRIGERFREGIRRLAASHGLPITIGGYPALTHFQFEDEQNIALGTLLTVRMLKEGFLASSGFYPTLGHEEHHVDAYLAAADRVFPELAEAIEKKDAVERIGGPVHHSGFARLT